jgi:uncharacterized DUF497 family protein
MRKAEVIAEALPQRLPGIAQELGADAGTGLLWIEQGEAGLDDGLAFQGQVEHCGLVLARTHGAQAQDLVTGLGKYDPLPAAGVDDASRGTEARDAVIGMDRRWNLLFVVHIQLEDDRLRIISARRATRAERALYED